ncbi:hypothetical protein NDU88_002751 [Pleurodeles waltl]|uniref:Uncharacterized protein n=1 Tax=Pleurodeles waltl TaxID=8319 RepID=A0AAV7KT15_PLEWA|nr:hypothetical protein NDU88_002751 [Pleurodeles waltl]
MLRPSGTFGRSLRVSATPPLVRQASRLTSCGRHPALSSCFYGAPAPPALQLRSPPWGTQPERRVSERWGAHVCKCAPPPLSVAGFSGGAADQQAPEVSCLLLVLVAAPWQGSLCVFWRAQASVRRRVFLSPRGRRTLLRTWRGTMGRRASPRSLGCHTPFRTQQGTVGRRASPGKSGWRTCNIERRVPLPPSFTGPRVLAHSSCTALSRGVGRGLRLLLIFFLCAGSFRCDAEN